MQRKGLVGEVQRERLLAMMAEQGSRPVHGAEDSTAMGQVDLFAQNDSLPLAA
jgi:hypothetical protein